MLPDLLYLSRADILQLALPPARMRLAMAEAFADLATGQCIALPKAQLDTAPGASFQAMVAASYRWSAAVLKWVGVVPVGSQTALPGISAVIALNDLATGHPLALMDGEVITTLRTAAMSALAAERMIARPPEVLAFAGCGAQAHSHLMALHPLFPSLRRITCFSRSPASANALAQAARERGLEALVTDDPRQLLVDADIAVSTVPAAPGLQPMLDAAVMKPDALALMVDLGRSWIPGSLRSFTTFATDSLDQMSHPLDARGQAVRAVTIAQDLRKPLALAEGRRAFCFRGHAAGDLAAAVLIHDLSRQVGIGRRIER